MLVALVIVAATVAGVVALALVPRMAWFDEPEDADETARSAGKRRRLAVIVVIGGTLAVSVRACGVVTDRQLDQQEELVREELQAADLAALGDTEAEFLVTVQPGGAGLVQLDEQLEHATMRAAFVEETTLVVGLETTWGPATRCFDLIVEPGGDYSLVEDDC